MSKRLKIDAPHVPVIIGTGLGLSIGTCRGIRESTYRRIFAVVNAVHNRDKDEAWRACVRLEAHLAKPRKGKRA